MANTKTRRSSKGSPRPRTRRAASKRSVRPRAPWYRSPTTAAAGLAIVALALAGAWLARGGGPTSPERPFVGGDLHSLVVTPATPPRLYVGGHEGAAVSTNGGGTWRQIESLSGADAMAWAFSNGRVMVGGHPGLFVSEDGEPFRLANDGLPATDIHGLGAGPGFVYAASPQVGLFASVDGGTTWEIRSQEVGGAFMGRILVDPADADHLLAPDMMMGAVESDDGGQTWRTLGGVPGAMWVSWDPGDTGHIVVSTMGNAALTSNGGRMWDPLEIPEGASVVEMSGKDPQTLFAGVLEGSEAVVWVSRDGGTTWNRP